MNKETVADAYVEAKDKVLNPEALSSTLLERMPTPTGWRLLILPYKGKGKTEGGIYLPDQVVEENTVSTQVGYVLKVGDLAFKDKSAEELNIIIKSDVHGSSEAIKNGKPLIIEKPITLNLEDARSILKLSNGFKK